MVIVADALYARRILCKPPEKLASQRLKLKSESPRHLGGHIPSMVQKGYKGLPVDLRRSAGISVANSQWFFSGPMTSFPRFPRRFFYDHNRVYYNSFDEQPCQD